MITFKILNDDIVIDSDGNIEMVEGADEVIQSVERTLTTKTGEWFLNVNHGLDYGIIKRKGYSVDDIKGAVTQAILQEMRILSVDSVETFVNDIQRSVAISFKATGIDGEVIAGEVGV